MIVKHELMYDEKKRDIVEDTFEKGKMEVIKEAAAQNQLHEMSRHDAGMSLQCRWSNCSRLNTTLGSALANNHIYPVALRIGSSHN